MPTSEELDALIARIAKEMESYDPESLGDDPAEFDSWLLLSDVRDALSALRDTNRDEWEYGWDSFGINQVAAPSREFAERICEGAKTHKVIRRRPAGPWEPVPSSPEGSK